MTEEDRRKVDLRRAHTDGPIDLCFDHTGTKILTCGNESDVRIFEGLSSITYSITANQAFAIGCMATRFLIGSDEHTVHCYQLEDGEKDVQIASFASEVTCMDISLDGTFIAAGSADHVARVIRFDPKDGIVGETFSYFGHSAPLISVALDPRGKYVASSSADGSVKIWLISPPACLKTWSTDPFHIPKANDYQTAKSLGRMSFEPKSGATVAIPFLNKVYLFNRDKWESIGSLEGSPHPSIAAYSPCGTHIAVASEDYVTLYHTATRKPVNKFLHPKQKHICALAWSPVITDRKFAYGDLDGWLGILENAFNASEPAVNNLKLLSGVSKPGFEERKVLPSKSTAYLDENSLDSAAEVNSEPIELNDDDDFGDDVVVDSKPARRTLAAHSQRTQMQKSFQPGSTHGSHRFMVWNEIGYIKTYTGEDEDDCMIDVVFHNSAYHRSIQVPNNHKMYKYSLGTMNDKGFFLATVKPAGVAHSEDPDDDFVRAKSSAIKFDTVSGAGDQGWTIILDDGEYVEGIALGENWCYAATDRGLIRVVTHAGYQLYIFSYPGPFLAIAASSHLMMLTYHQSEPFDGYQSVAFSVCSMQLRRMDVVVQDQRLPLSPKSDLAWLGFGVRKTPCMMDSKGLMRVLHYQGPLPKVWSPCLDTRIHLKSKFDHYFVVGLDEDKRQARAIYCRGSTYPRTLPLPTQSLLPLDSLHVGLKDSPSVMLKTESDACLARLFPPRTDQALKEMTASVIRLFVLHCDQSDYGRAQDIMQALVPRVTDFKMFSKAVSASCRGPVAERMQKAIVDMIKEENEDDVIRPPSPPMFGGSEEDDDSDERDDKSASKPSTILKNTAAPLPAHPTPKTVTLSRHKPIVPKPSVVDTLKRFRQNSNASESDSEEDLRPPRPNASRSIMTPTPSVTMRNGGKGKKILTVLDEDTRMFADEYEYNEEDPKSVDIRSQLENHDSQSNEASISSAQTIVFDREQSARPYQTKAKEKFVTPNGRDNKRPISATLSGGNPFRKTVEQVPVLTRGISTMEELTKARCSKPLDAEEVGPGSRKRSRKPLVASTDSAAKRKLKNSGEVKGLKSDFGAEEVKLSSAQRSGSLGLAKYGFTRDSSKQPEVAVDGDVEEPPSYM